jgi:hypothetical protein
MKTPGQIAYEAYCDFVGWESFSGQTLPAWEYQDESLRAAWEAAAEAVLDSTREELNIIRMKLQIASSRGEIQEALKGISREELAELGIV